MLIALIGLAIVAAVAVYIGLPLTRPASPLVPDGDPRAELLQRRDAVYREIADLDFENGEGRISPADYRRQRDEYLDEAAGLLERIDQVPAMGGSDPILEAIERELAELGVRRTSLE